MKMIEKVGRTREEAVAEALCDLGVDIDQATVEVLEETASGKGLFGLLGSAKGIRVRVTVKEDTAQGAALFLREMLVNMGIPAQVEILRRSDNILLNISGPDIGVLVGMHGQTLDAVQYLVNLAVNKNRVDRERIVVDAEGYRQRREETLSRLAVKVAEKVKSQGKKEELEPMSPYERRVIHATLQDDTAVFTYSEGEEPRRRVIVSPQNNKE
jgi:spoIIIJ-associated protein